MELTSVINLNHQFSSNYNGSDIFTSCGFFYSNWGDNCVKCIFTESNK